MKSETIYTVYSQESDMTFIMKDTEAFNYELGVYELASTEVIGFYFGEPDEETTEKYIGKLKAEF